MTDPGFLVLASLADGDKHGYAMMDDIESFTGVRLGPGTLYGAITRLVERGLIQPSGSDHRRTRYRLTAEGHRQLEKQLQALDKVVKVAHRRTKPA